MKATTKAGVLAMLAGGLLTAGTAGAAGCPPDSVKVGHLCVDKYEASVWRIPTSLANAAALVAAVEAGTITSAAQLAGAIRKGDGGDDYGAGCPDNGAGRCTRFYAVSIPGVRPSADTTWFQAVAACTNAGKRLLTNQEWTAAALGTPDPGPDNGTSNCNSNTSDFESDPVNTGSRGACVSDRGAYDMVGNVWEWVADWVPLSTACPGWGVFSNDWMCLAGASTTDGPGALLRGGDFMNGAPAGPLAVNGMNRPSYSGYSVGFRCAREL